MALQKLIELNNTGIFSEYWRVILVNIDYETLSAHVVIAGYKDEEARRAKKSPIDARSLDFNESNFPFGIEAMSAPDTNSVLVSYAKFKELVPEFQDAVDLLVNSSTI